MSRGKPNTVAPWLTPANTSHELPPAVKFPPTTKPVTNMSGQYVVLTTPAFEKLRYWSVFRQADGTFMARFSSSTRQPLAQFGPFTIVHLRPIAPDK